MTGEMIEEMIEEMEEMTPYENLPTWRDLIEDRVSGRFQQPQFEMSEWLFDKCTDLWDIYNTRSEELDRVARDHPIANRLTTMRIHAKRKWDRTAIMEYHMGTCFSNDNGAIGWALKSNTKIKALNHRLIEGGISISPEDMKKDLQYVVKILEANGQDEIKWTFIQDYYNFWNDLPEGQLYAI